MQDSVIRKISTSNGIGFFTGPLPPIITRAYLTRVTIFSAILAIFVVPLALITVDATWDYVAGLCALTTIGLPIIGIRLSRRPAKPIKVIEANGIWISNEIISWGKKPLEFEQERTLPELYSPQNEPIRLVGEMTLPEEAGTHVDTQKATVTFQITHSRKNKKYYRIVLIHVSQDGKNIHSHNLIVDLGVPILIVNGELFPIYHTTVADQLRKIADTIKSFENGGANLSNLLITPRTNISIGIPLAVGAAVGGVAQSIADSKKFHDIVNGIAKGDFVDPETGKFLLELIQNYKWNIGYRPLGDKELGLSDQW
jgi:hypothetical protein